MNRLASLSAIALLVSACASHNAAPATSAKAQPVHAVSTQTVGASGEVGMRRFYLLSPGPKETLVVTRSDVPSLSH